MTGVPLWNHTFVVCWAGIRRSERGGALFVTAVRTIVVGSNAQELFGFVGAFAIRV